MKEQLAASLSEGQIPELVEVPSVLSGRFGLCSICLGSTRSLRSKTPPSASPLLEWLRRRPNDPISRLSSSPAALQFSFSYIDLVRRPAKPAKCSGRRAAWEDRYDDHYCALPDLLVRSTRRGSCRRGFGRGSAISARSSTRRCCGTCQSSRVGAIRGCRKAVMDASHAR
jgi:hypothetical protein